MTDIHDPCRANMAKADRALRSSLDEIEHLKDELADWRKEGERLRADADKAWTEHLIERENLRAKITSIQREADKIVYESGLMLGEAHKEIARLKAERHTTKEMLEDVLKRHGVLPSETPHYGLGRGGLGGAGQRKP
jgi:chromosome segregation ATPase